MYQLKDYLYSINQSKKNILDDDPDAARKYPAYVVNRCLSSFTDTYVKEMKILLNELLDEREGKMDYTSYFDTEKFKHFVGEEEPAYKCTN